MLHFTTHKHLPLTKLRIYKWLYGFVLFFLFLWPCTTLHFRTTRNVFFFFRCVHTTWSCGKLIDSIGFWFCEEDGSSFNLVTTLVLTIVKPLSYFDQTVWFLQSWKNDDWLHARLTGSDTRHETSVMQCLPGGKLLISFSEYKWYEAKMHYASIHGGCVPLKS